ncbi:MAG TPA: hypothetical protein PLD47_05840, partial [Aggregatilineales bacterium]|nr:hypothetical protein [Aggregatilineales bacterium]
MRLSPVLTVLSALAAVVLFGLVGAPLIAPNRPLLENVAFSVNIISPNADGDSDLTKIRYTVNKTARVSVVFTETTTGETFRFRDEATRAPNTYEVLFSGVVEGYTLPDERIEGVIERRLIPNGLYRWTLTTTTETGEMSSVEGDLTISGVDSRLPALTTFEVSPKEFTPNQDGYDDRVSINLTLEKPATLTVWLENDTNGPYYIAERVIAAATADGAGAREFDYDGGVDNNMTPPPDGEYRLIAVAQDAEGQRVRRETTIQLRDGGLPNAEIVAQSSGRTVTWAASTWEDRFFHDRQTRGALVEPPLTVQSTQAQISLPQGDLLVFAMTVSNYGTTPIRTIGPFPGTAYSYDQTDAAMTAPERR